jgi:hypothetical protein
VSKGEEKEEEGVSKGEEKEEGVSKGEEKEEEVEPRTTTCAPNHFHPATPLEEGGGVEKGGGGPALPGPPPE